jgi:hypothetical protein
MRIANLAAPAVLAAALVIPTVAQAGGVLGTLQGLLLGERQRSAVTLASVGKELEPGVFEVDPKAVMGRRVVFSPSGPAPQLVCIGHWAKNACNGILVDTRPQTGGPDIAPPQIPAAQMPPAQPSPQPSSTPPSQ